MLINKIAWIFGCSYISTAFYVVLNLRRIYFMRLDKKSWHNCINFLLQHIFTQEHFHAPRTFQFQTSLINVFNKKMYPFDIYFHFSRCRPLYLYNWPFSVHRLLLKLYNYTISLFPSTLIKISRSFISLSISCFGAQVPFHFRESPNFAEWLNTFRFCSAMQRDKVLPHHVVLPNRSWVFSFLYTRPFWLQGISFSIILLNDRYYDHYRKNEANLSNR